MGSQRNLKIIGIIPARGGSKSIKDKNLVKVKNQNLIEDIYLKAKKSNIFSKIVCSSESNKILNFCKRKKIPFIKRPQKFSKDSSNVIDAVKHVLEIEKKLSQNEYGFITLLQPTSPFLTISDIKKCCNLIRKKNSLNCVQTIHQTPHNYHYLNTRIIKKNFLEFKFEKERKIKFNKQKKTKTYNFGNLIISRINRLLKDNSLFLKPCGFIEINKIKSFDLDSFEDIDIAKNLKRIS